MPNGTGKTGHKKVALAIPGFIASRCLFYFAVPKPDKELFHLLLQILEPDFFESLGFGSFTKNGKPDQRAIKRRIKNIADKYRDDFPDLKPDLKKLDFSSLAALAASFCRMVRDLEM